MSIAHLPERGVLRITGSEAKAFLDRLVTNDMDLVSPEAAGFGALLTPQGKIIADFLIVALPEEDGGGFLLDTSVGTLAELKKKLTLYRLRADVQILDLTEEAAVVAAADGGLIAPEAGVVYADPRHPGLGDRAVVDKADLAGLVSAPAEEHHLRRITLGVPDAGKDFGFGEAFPHEAMMDQLGGVSFSKGCYVGQEVVSRMEHRGTARTRIVPVTFTDGVRPEPGVEARAGEKTIGRIGTTIRARGMAMLRLDRVADAMAAGEALTGGGLPFVIERPDFIRFPMPGDADFGKADA